MQRVEAYRVEVAVVTKDEYSKELEKAEKAIDDLEKKTKKGAKAHDDLAKSSKDVAKAQDSVAKSTKSAAKGVEGVGKSAEQAEKKVKRTTKTFESFGSKVKALQRAKATVEVAVKDNATRVLNRVRGTWDSFRRNPITRLTVTAVDRAMRVLRGIKNTVLSIPTMITIGLSYVGVKNLSEATVGAAMNWEKYEVSMEHWLDGNTKKAKELTKWMGQFADVTPFSSPELFPALTHAVSITDKDLDKSKRLLGIASDMAALTPGYTVEDAMGAIANAKMGNTVRLEGFGLDITKKQMDDMGGWDKLLDKLEKDFKGGAEKLSKTASGVLATLKGYRGSFMRSIGTGILEPMKPRLDAINQWLENNQDKWGRWKDVAMGHGKDLSESVFSTLERGFGHVQSKYLENPDFMNLDLKGKIKFISDDVGDFMNGTVKPKLTEWWDETGSGVALEIGKSIGSGIVEGIKLGIQAGGELLTSSYSDLFENLKKDPFSKDTGKSALGAMATTAGAAYLGKKLIYNPGRSVYRGGKKVKDWTGGRTHQSKERTSGRRNQPKQITQSERTRLAKAEMERAKRYSQTPQAYRPPKEAKSVLNFAGGPASKNILKGVGGKIPGLNLLFGALDASSGWKDASSIMGKASDELTFFDKSTASAAKILEGFSFGLLNAEKTANWFSGGKTETGDYPMEYGVDYEEQPGMGWKPGTSDHPLAAAWTPDLGSMEGLGKGAGFSLNTEILQRNIDTLTTYVGEASGHVVGAFQPLAESTSTMRHNMQVLTGYLGEASSWVVGAFHPLSEGTSVLQHNIQALTMHLGDASGHVAGAFYPMSEQGPILQQNTSALSTNLAEASVSVVESFYPLSENGPVMNQNVSALTTNLAESSSWVVGAFYPLSESGPTLTNNVSVLSSWVAQASGWVNSLYGIQDGAAAVKGALSNLASRISRVPTPSVSVGGGGPASGPRVTAYARGGVATSPHVGLVGEAGVNESMIPWDGSNRSKALWQQTGEALGMFDGDSSSSGGGNAAVATSGMTGGSSGGMALDIGDINVNGGNNMSAEEILNMITPALYERIKATLAKRR